MPYGKSGFVQSIEFLKKFFKFAQQFSRPRKSLEKMVKSLEFFFLPSYDNCFISEIFSFRPHVYRASWKKLCFCVLKVSIDHLFDNRKSGKNNYCFGKEV